MTDDMIHLTRDEFLAERLGPLHALSDSLRRFEQEAAVETKHLHLNSDLSTIMGQRTFGRSLGVHDGVQKAWRALDRIIDRVAAQHAGPLFKDTFAHDTPAPMPEGCAILGCPDCGATPDESCPGTVRPVANCDWKDTREQVYAAQLAQNPEFIESVQNIDTEAVDAEPPLTAAQFKDLMMEVHPSNCFCGYPPRTNPTMTIGPALQAALDRSATPEETRNLLADIDMLTTELVAMRTERNDWEQRATASGEAQKGFRINLGNAQRARDEAISDLGAAKARLDTKEKVTVGLIKERDAAHQRAEEFQRQRDLLYIEQKANQKVIDQLMTERDALMRERDRNKTPAQAAEDETPIPNDLIADVWRCFRNFDDSTTIREQAVSYPRVWDKVSDLTSYHPRYNNRTGEIDGVMEDD